MYVSSQPLLYARANLLLGIIAFSSCCWLYIIVDSCLLQNSHDSDVCNARNQSNYLSLLCRRSLQFWDAWELFFSSLYFIGNVYLREINICWLLMVLLSGSSFWDWYFHGYWKNWTFLPWQKWIFVFSLSRRIILLSNSRTTDVGVFKEIGTFRQGPCHREISRGIRHEHS